MSRYYRYVNEDLSSPRMNATYEDLAAEHKTLSGLINNLLRHSGLSSEFVSHAREKAKECCKDSVNRITTAIQRKAVLQRDVNEHYYTNKGTTVTNPAFENITAHLCNLIYNAMVRQENILEVQANYLDLDEDAVNADKSGIKAASLFAVWAQTDTGYRNNVLIKGTVDADPTVSAYEEKLEEATNYQCPNRTKYKRVCESTHTYEVNQSWYADVFENGIAQTDIGGKKCLTTSAKLIEEHELKDQDVALYDCNVIYTKKPIDANTWNTKPGEPKAWFHIEARHVAVQTLPSGKKEIATGKDKSWAIRTMKMRMKSNMMKQMGLK